MSDLDVIQSSREPADRGETSLAPPLLQAFSWSRLTKFGSSLADQMLSVGGMFLANIALARVQSKEEYGMFALSYSVYTFLAGLHNAGILEPYTIHGPGRYHARFSEYSRLMSRNNAGLCLVLTLSLLLAWSLLRKAGSALASRSFLGLALTIAVLLTSLFVRRTLYLRRRPDLAAKFSTISFVMLISLLFLFTRFGLLNGLSVFLIAAASWIVAGIFMWRELPKMSRTEAFKELESNHRLEHWKYARWVLATALVFQLTNQGYYWLLAGFLSLKEVGDLRAMNILVGPVDQILVALSMLVLPMMAFRYASKQHSRLISLWKTFGLMSFGITLSYAIFIWILAKPLMHSVYVGKFDDVSTWLGTLALLPVVMGIGNSANVALKSIERPDIVLYAYLASGAATFLMGIPLVIHFGLRGAVYGMLVSASVYTITMLVGLVSLALTKVGGVRLFSPTIS
jgi:O-antigen/teichoic acid export membrane protein